MPAKESPSKRKTPPKRPVKGRPKASRRNAREDDKSSVWTLRLYITGRGDKSVRALSNLKRLCKEHMPDGAYHIEVVDLMKNPHMAKADQIIAIPTLIRKVPEPMKRVIGDLSNAERAMLSLDLPMRTSEP